MATLTVTEARQKLGGWLDAAIAGKDVRIVRRNALVALRPVPLRRDDDALQEYGLTARQLARAHRRIREQIKAERARGTVRGFTGKAEDLRG